MLYPIQSRKRIRIDLSGIWNAAVDKENTGIDNQWFVNPPKQMELATNASWNDQTVDWEFHNYVGSVWYWRTFYVPDTWRNKRIVLRIGSANYRACVWVNDKSLGEHEGGYMPFEFDIGDLVSYSDENRLVIRVNNELSEETIPQGNLSPDYGGVALGRVGNFPDVHYDFFPYGGIHRPVVIYCTERDYIEDITVRTAIRGSQGIVRFHIACVADKAAKAIITMAGNNVEKALSPSGELAGEIIIDPCEFWSPQTPHLYDLDISLLDAGGKLLDDYTLPVGVRTIKVEGLKLLLNGQPIYLKGFGRHEDLHIIGRGLSFPFMVKDFNLMKWANANSFRTSHYPYSEEIMRMADRWGFMVIDETAANTISLAAANEKTLQEHRRQLRELYQRDKNHPSVIMWSISNESELFDKRSKPYFKTLLDDMRSLDDTRPITLVSQANFDKEAGALQGYDIICYNNYPAWYGNCGRLDKIEQLLEEQLDGYFDRYKKPIMLSEFGADAIAGFHALPAEMWSEEYQKITVEKICSVLRKKKYIVGEHVWNFADFKTGQHTARPIYNHKGVFTRDRQPKMVAFLLKKLWEQKP